MSDFIVNSFQLPNSVVDELLADLTGAELKCYLLVVRKTKGWNKEIDSISIGQFMEVTGLSNRSVITACDSLVEKGLLVRSGGERRLNTYSVKSFNISQTGEKSSSVKSGEKISQTGEKSSSDLVKKVHTQNNNKNTIQNTNKKNTKKSVLELLADFGITGQLADDFMIHRKACRAPITGTALKGFQREADKAGIPLAEAITISIERNWRGFKSEWDWRGGGVIHRQQQKMTFTEKNAQPWNREEDWEGVF
nr:MAG TPA: replication protein O [Caudoviricetes sp.]